MAKQIDDKKSSGNSTIGGSHWSRRKKVFLFVALPVVVVILAGVYLVMWSPFSSSIASLFNHRTTTSKPTQQGSGPDTVVQSLPRQASISADEAIANGDNNKATQIYTDAINTASNDEDRGATKLEEAYSFISIQKYDVALKAALEAEKYLQSSPTLIQAVSTIGRIYQDMGDNANAVIYYQKTVNLIDSTQSVIYNRQYYVDLVNTLGAR